MDFRGRGAKDLLHGFIQNRVIPAGTVACFGERPDSDDDPALPEKWEGLSFKIMYRDRLLKISIQKEKATMENLEGASLDLYLSGKVLQLESGGSVIAFS